MDWNPFNDWLYATASDDKSVGLWDLRNPSRRVHSLLAHQSQVYKVQWNPHNQAILASGSADRKVVIWDLSQVRDQPASY